MLPILVSQPGFVLPKELRLVVACPAAAYVLLDMFLRSLPCILPTSQPGTQQVCDLVQDVLPAPRQDMQMSDRPGLMPQLVPHAVTLGSLCWLLPAPKQIMQLSDRPGLMLSRWTHSAADFFAVLGACSASSLGGSGLGCFLVADLLVFVGVCS